MPADPIDIELLDRYLARAATPDEIATVEAWIAKRPENAQALQTFRTQFGLTNGEPPPSDANTVWTRIASRLDATPGTAPIPLRILRPTPKPKRPWFIPSAIGLAASAAALVLYVRLDRPSAPSAPPPPKQYAATKGQRADLRLTDGTRVVLAPDSRLIVPAFYDSLDRTVILEGQAYFDVVHSDAKPFSVKAGTAFIRDIGTRFDVRAFQNESSVRVVVTQGKVQLGRSMAPIDSARLLVAGNLGRVRESGEVSVAQRVDTTRFVSWTRGVLVFDRTPVPEALAELSRWYDVDVQLADESLAKLTLTAMLRDQSLSEALNVVALSLGTTAERRGRMVTFTSRHRGGSE